MVWAFLRTKSSTEFGSNDLHKFIYFFQIGDITYISGQIALIPGSMTIIDGGIRPQCKLTLRHISRVAKAMNAQGQLRDVVQVFCFVIFFSNSENIIIFFFQGICFVTHPSYITECRRQWERQTTNAIIDYIVIPALPRQALVEWQVWAHTHNDRFDCKILINSFEKKSV